MDDSRNVNFVLIGNYDPRDESDTPLTVKYVDNTITGGTQLADMIASTSLTIN